jgi:hypothetical protein
VAIVYSSNIIPRKYVRLSAFGRAAQEEFYCERCLTTPYHSRAAANEHGPRDGQITTGHLIQTRIPVEALNKPKLDALDWFPAVFVKSPVIELKNTPSLSSL